MSTCGVPFFVWLSHENPFVGKWGVIANEVWPPWSRLAADRGTWTGVSIMPIRIEVALGPPLGPIRHWAWALSLDLRTAFLVSSVRLWKVSGPPLVGSGSCFVNRPNHSYYLVLTVRWEVWTSVFILSLRVTAWEWIWAYSIVKSSDPSKNKTGERTLAPGEVPLLTEIADRVVNLSPQMIRLVTHTIADEINAHCGKNKRKIGSNAGLPPVKKARTGGVVINEPAATTARKSPAIIKKLINKANVDSRVAAYRLEEFVSSSVTFTLEHDYEDESVSNHDDNVVPCVPSMQTNTDIVGSEPVDETHGSSVPRTEVGGPCVPENETGTSSAVPDQGSPVDDFYDSQTIDYAAAQNIYVPNWDVTNNAWMDDHIMCRNLVDRVPLLGYWASLRNLSDTDFLDRVNLNYAQHVCMVFELCLCYEHEITIREKFKKKFNDSSEVIQQRDVEIIKLGSKWGRQRVRQVSGLESVCDGLKGKVVGLESECERLWDQVEGKVKMNELFMAKQDDVVQWVIGHGLRMAFMKCCQSVEYQTALGKRVSTGETESEKYFFEMMMFVVKHDGLAGYDADTIIESTCMTLIVSSSDTMIVMLTWTLSLLLNNRDALKKAQEELELQVGDRQVTESDIKYLVYLQAVVKETLRLYPAAFLGGPRVILEDCIIAGYNVPKGTWLLINTWYLSLF
nr:cytochrome P450 CYP82D47-like [Tanacetum cinerariifolium]